MTGPWAQVTSRSVSSENNSAQQAEKPEIGVSIVNYRSLDDTQELLQNFDQFDNTLTLHVVVVDNSAYEAVAEAEALRASCRSAKFPCEYVPSANVGYAGGHNTAFAQLADCDVDGIWVLNPDCRLEGSGAEALAQSLIASRGMARIFATTLRDSVTRDLRPAVSIIELCTTRTLPIMTSSAVKASYWRLAFAEGYSFLITRDALTLLREFDDDLFLFYEEVELMTRASRLGVGLMVLEGVVVQHAQGGSTRSGANTVNRSTNTLYHANRSCVLFYRKHHVLLLGNCLIARTMQALGLILRGELGRSTAVTRGICAGLLHHVRGS